KTSGQLIRYFCARAEARLDPLVIATTPGGRSSNRIRTALPDIVVSSEDYDDNIDAKTYTLDKPLDGSGVTNHRSACPHWIMGRPFGCPCLPRVSLSFPGPGGRLSLGRPALRPPVYRPGRISIQGGIGVRSRRFVEYSARTLAWPASSPPDGNSTDCEFLSQPVAPRLDSFCHTVVRDR